MFRENIVHNQVSLFNTTSLMNESVKKKLENSWAPIFYEHVFCKIDEKPFAVMYSDTGRPNTSPKIFKDPKDQIQLVFLHQNQ